MKVKIWSQIEVRLDEVPYWYDNGSVTTFSKNDKIATLAEVLQTATTLRKNGEKLLKQAEEVFAFLDKRIDPPPPKAGELSLAALGNTAGSLVMREEV